MAIVAMISVPSTSPSTPKCPSPVFQTLVVKKFQIPLDLNAGRDLSTRKNSVARTMSRLTEAAAVASAAEDPVARRRIELRRAGDVSGFHRGDGAVSDAHESSPRGSVGRSGPRLIPDDTSR